MKLLIMQYAPASCHVLPLRLRYSKHTFLSALNLSSSLFLILKRLIVSEISLIRKKLVCFRRKKHTVKERSVCFCTC